MENLRPEVIHAQYKLLMSEIFNNFLEFIFLLSKYSAFTLAADKNGIALNTKKKKKT